MPFLVSTVSKQVVAATAIASAPVPPQQIVVVETFCYEQAVTLFGIPTGTTTIECTDRPVRNMIGPDRSFKYYETTTAPVIHSFSTR
jgi:hypothetical protein